MHYIGMHAMRMGAMCHFDPSVVALSVILAVLISFVALRLVFVARNHSETRRLRKVASAPGLRDGDREIVEASGLVPSFATFREVANPASPGLGGVTGGPASGPCLQEPAMKADSQSVPQIGEVNYVLRHSGQPNDSELLSALLENTADSIYFKDLESRFLKISHALAKKLRRHHPDDAVGKSDSDFFAQAHAQEALEDERRIIRTGSPLLSKEERETWPDGTETWVLTNKMALLDAEGIVVGTLGISHDITAKKTAENALRRAEEKYRAIFEDAVVGIFQITPEGRPLNINRALAQMHGYDSPQQLLAEVSNVARQLFVDPLRMGELAHALDENGVVRGAQVEVYRRDPQKSGCW